MAGLAAALLLLLAGCLRGATAAAGAPAPARQAGQLSDAAFERATVVIEDADARRPVILQSLFNGTLDTIIFDIPSFTLVPAAWVFVTPETPYVLTRNFTILSQLTPPTVIDFSFLEGKVVMEPSTSFGFDGVALLKTTRLDTLYISFFLNSPGAVLHIHNSILIDPVCNASSPAEDLAAAQALPQLPGQSRNLVTAAPALCMKVQQEHLCFDSGVLLHALTVVVASSDRRAQGIAYTQAEAAAALAAGGFLVQYTNSTRVCRQYLSESCLAQHPDNRTACWEQAAAAAAGRPVGGADSGDSIKTTVGAVVGGVLGAILLACVALLVWRRRRRSKAHGSSDCSSSFDKPHQAGLLSAGGQGDASRGRDSSQRYRPGQDTSSSRRLLEDGSVPQGSLQQQYLLGMTLHEQPPRQAFGRDGLHLGVLLGAGSYGRVYKGKWHGREVAIKIIHCQPSELQRVLREAEIMLHLDHPNVVRALNCILQHKPKGKAVAAAGAGSGQGSSALVSGQLTEQAGSGSGRRSSTTSSVSQMLPVLRRSLQHGSGGSNPSTRSREQHGPGDGSLSASQDTNVVSNVPPGASGPAVAAAAAAVTGARSGSGSSGSRQDSRCPAVADQQHNQQQQQQQLLKQVAGQEPKPPVQQEVQVLPVLATGSDGTAGSTPGGQQQQQQQQLVHSSWQQGSGGAADAGDDDDDDGEQVAEVWLVLELCTGGNLQDASRQHRDGFDLARLLCRLAEVAQGMAYLHSKQIMHGDLKAANVLLVNSIHGSFGQIAKLTDFGLSGVLRDGHTHHSTQHLGTISHCAPEVLQHGHTSPAADVFAFGIMMWELFTATSAFKDVHYGTIIQRVVLGGERPSIHPDTPEDYALLMEACWASSPSARPTFEQVLECLTIMLHSLDTPTTATNAVLSAQQHGSAAAAAPTSAVTAAAAGAAGATAGAVAVAAAGQPPQAAAQVPPAATAVPTVPPAAAAVGPSTALAAAGPLVAHSSSLGSFDMCRTASNTSSIIGSSSATASSLNRQQRLSLSVSTSSEVAAGARSAAPAAGAATGAVPDSAAAAAGTGAAAGAVAGAEQGAAQHGRFKSWQVRQDLAGAAVGGQEEATGAAAAAAAGSLVAPSGGSGSSASSSRSSAPQRRTLIEPGLGPVAEVAPATAGVGQQQQEGLMQPSLPQQQQLGQAAGPLIAAGGPAGAAAAGTRRTLTTSTCPAEHSSRPGPPAPAAVRQQGQATPALAAAAAADAGAQVGAGAGGVETTNSTGSAGTSCSASSSKLKSMQGAQSRHIQDLW